ncbi:MAG TPA: T9SS type A sorting domain-containing protein [Caldithrix sp.]|nr:T9SS type A sorting domain-containing protein [Caldithrix sp.]
MKHLLSIFLIILIFVPVGRAQTPVALLPVATDSTKDEIDPYLTYYWYDGNFYWDREESSTGFSSPLWLIYVEIDSLNHNRVIARNISVDWDHNVNISEKFVVSDTTVAAEMRNPLLENFLGKPVAVWEQYENSRFRLYYSYAVDSLWTIPQKIIDSPSDQHSAVFVTQDDSYLPGQSDSLNCLIYISDSTILASSLKSDYSWREVDTVFQAQHSVANLKARVSTNKNLWLIFDEFPSPDSVVLKTCIREDSSGNWVGPFDLLSMHYPSQANINLHIDSWNKNSFRLGWVENKTLYEKNIWYENDSLNSGSIWQIPLNPLSSEVKVASNNLLPGGCVIAPFPWYFTAEKIDSLYFLSLVPGLFTEFWFRDSVAFIDNMSVSGLTNDHCLLGWNEKTFGQNDIYLYLFYFPVGGTEDAVIEQPRMFRLFQNYPNPFNPETTIEYFLPKAVPVQLEIYNLLGQRVRTLVSGQKPAGEHQVSWDGRDYAGREVASGVYFYRLSVGNRFVQNRLPGDASQTGKMLLLR